MIKKLVAFILVFTLSISTYSLCYAEEQILNTSDKHLSLYDEIKSTDAEKINELLYKVRPAWADEVIYPDKEFVEYCDLMKEAGYISVNPDGHFEISNNIDEKLINDSHYSEFVDTINFCNYIIDLGMFEIDSELLELRPLELTDKTLNKIANEGKESALFSVAPTGAHGCSYYELDLGRLCANNYNELEDFYNAIVRTLPFNPYVNPWLTTAGYWVGKVMEGGDWDYKVQPGFSPWYTVFCCRYGGKVFMHQTSEWIGNYNYGYTGSFLFSLDVLHFGSSAVAGFDPADREDWPAIDEGYYDAP